MNYRICELESFSVIGQEIELTNSQKENTKICVDFWRKFNNNLKKEYLLRAFISYKEIQAINRN